MLKPFIKAIIASLGIKLPVSISISTKENLATDGWYLPVFNDDDELCSHRIRIYLNEDTSRSVEAVIAHELIHAWQEENSDTGVHGRKFAYRARKLEKQFELTNVYIPRTDV